MTPRFTGIWPAFVTPIAADGSPALDVVEQLVELFVSQKLGGLYLTGSTGQWPYFTVAERQAIVERAIRVAAGRLPIIVHVGAMTTADAVALTRHAQRVGADGVSAVGPTYYGHSVEGILAYYRAIAEASDLPVYAYHLSSVNQMALGARQFAQRLADIKGLAGMKITDLNLYPFGLIRSVVGERWTLFSGADELLCHAVLSGADGAIGTFYNLWGPECATGLARIVAGDVAGATRFMQRFQVSLADVLESGGIWSFLREAMRQRFQLDIGMPRPPLGATDRVWQPGEVEAILLRMDGA